VGIVLGRIRKNTGKNQSPKKKKGDDANKKKAVRRRWVCAQSRVWEIKVVVQRTREAGTVPQESTRSLASRNKKGEFWCNNNEPGRTLRCRQGEAQERWKGQMAMYLGRGTQTRENWRHSWLGEGRQQSQGKGKNGGKLENHRGVATKDWHLLAQDGKRVKTGTEEKKGTRGSKNLAFQLLRCKTNRVFGAARRW